MEECDGEGDGDGDGAAESGGKCLQEVDLGMDSELLFEEVAVEVIWVSVSVSAVYGQREEDHLGK